jgi:hypothetical protein
MAYKAPQWQATAEKNQLVLGPQHTVISAEDFGQVSTIKVPDPGRSISEFVLTDSKTGSQVINGNLTVTGVVQSKGGSSGDELLNGDLVFSNAADRAIRFNATKQSGDAADLSIVGNSSDSGVGGQISITAGNSGPTKAGGDVNVTGGTGNTTGNGGALNLTGGTSGKTGPTIGGSVNITSGHGATSGDISLEVDPTSSASGRILIGNNVVKAPAGIILGQRTNMTGGILVQTNGTIILNAGGLQTMQFATTSVASPTASATLHTFAGKVTFTGFTTAAGARQAFTVTNNQFSLSDAVLATVCNKGSKDAQMTLTRVNTETDGVLIFNTINNGTDVLNGDVNITFWILDSSS